MAVDTYRFDVSVSGPSDPNTVWSADANAFDSDESTGSVVSEPNNGSTSSNFLQGNGTNAPTSGSTAINQVRARLRSGGDSVAGQLNGAVYTSGLGELLGTPTGEAISFADWYDYVVLSEPSGGWTWQKVSELEVKLYATGMASTESVVARMVGIEVTHDIVLEPDDNNLTFTADNATITQVHNLSPNDSALTFTADNAIVVHHIKPLTPYGNVSKPTTPYGDPSKPTTDYT